MVLQRSEGEPTPASNAATAVEKQTAVPTEVKPIPQEYRPFTDQEERALIEDGAHFIDLAEETIEDQRKSGRLLRYVTNGGDRLLKVPSISTRVAIYTDPRRFFIPNSNSKDLLTQEKLAKKDGQELRERLGLEDDSLDVIIPNQAATFTALIFKYLDETTKQGKGVWLFGPDYAYQYGRTKNPLNELGSDVAGVGNARPDSGIGVSNWYADRGVGNIWIVRFIVAKKI